MLQLHLHFWCVNFAERANHPKLRRNCAFPQNFHTMKLGKIMVFYALKDFLS